MPAHATKARWWRPLELTIAVTVLALAGIVGWGLLKDRFQSSEDQLTEGEVVVAEAAELAKSLGVEVKGESTRD